MRDKFSVTQLCFSGAVEALVQNGTGPLVSLFDTWPTPRRDSFGKKVEKCTKWGEERVYRGAPQMVYIAGCKF